MYKKHQQTKSIALIESENCMLSRIIKLHNFSANLSVWVVWYRRKLEKPCPIRHKRPISLCPEAHGLTSWFHRSINVLFAQHCHYIISFIFYLDAYCLQEASTTCMTSWTCSLYVSFHNMLMTSNYFMHKCEFDAVIRTISSVIKWSDFRKRHRVPRKPSLYCEFVIIGN